jgi:hypothetical protein
MPQTCHSRRPFAWVESWPSLALGALVALGLVWARSEMLL